MLLVKVWAEAVLKLVLVVKIVVVIAEVDVETTGLTVLE
jgi:hypothetical protein